jgi:bifunctional non-homologous end joining protein LigD
VVAYCVFDILVYNGKNIMGLPLAIRKEILLSLFQNKPPGILPVKAIETEGEWLYEQAVALKLEGVVGKLAASPYVPGVRTRNWVKVKRPGHILPQRFKRGR